MNFRRVLGILLAFMLGSHSLFLQSNDIFDLESDKEDSLVLCIASVLVVAVVGVCLYGLGRNASNEELQAARRQAQNEARRAERAVQDAEGVREAALLAKSAFEKKLEQEREKIRPHMKEVDKILGEKDREIERVELRLAEQLSLAEINLQPKEEDQKLAGEQLERDSKQEGETIEEIKNERAALRLRIDDFEAALLESRNTGFAKEAAKQEEVDRLQSEQTKIVTVRDQLTAQCAQQLSILKQILDPVIETPCQVVVTVDDGNILICKQPKDSEQQPGAQPSLEGSEMIGRVSDFNFKD